ncbi:hypothetical protein COO64_06250 [Pseudomonas donghuensis]|nr:hypothetical protein COO64_06250 [Pseudomonas donghuensis]
MELPIDFIRFHLRFRYFAIVKIKNLRPGISRAHLETLGIRDEFFRKNNGRDVGSDEKIWSTDGMTVISLGDLIRCLTPVSDSFEGEAKISIDFDSKCPIFAYFDGVFIPAALEVEYEYVDKLYSIPMSTLTYEQLEYGSLGWVMEGSLETPLGKLESKIPIYKAENGMYKMRDSDVIIEGVKGVTMQIYREGFDEPWYG